MRGRERELKKLEEMAVYERVPRAVAMQDREGKFVRTRWVEVQKEKEVRCRSVAEEYAAGDPQIDFFAGTPSAFRSSSSGVHGRHLSPTSMGAHGT